MAFTTRRETTADIGVIGGSGLYDIEGMADVHELRVTTPFGRPSDVIVFGTIGSRRVAFLSRHGRGHRFSPTTINYRANIYALKSVGVRQVVSIGAVGSMQESIKPGDIVLPDQFLDLTKHRTGSFFDSDLVAHVGLGMPVCPRLGPVLEKAARGVDARVHRGGSYLCIEGPQFSTKGESLLYRSWGVSVIGMTNMPEAKLAREAELCYAAVSMVTDYDCWHESETAVSVDTILSVLRQNVALAKRLLREVVPNLEPPSVCACPQALQGAIITDPRMIGAAARRRLRVLLEKYLPAHTRKV
ncbi:S-methyl-5'-thioadenosine phosphorylase [Nitrospira sp.]|nr:S-methyl-5'-thioadenosine phosphorylase [Nitrospira sp.]